MSLQGLIGIAGAQDWALCQHVKHPRPVCEICHQDKLHVRLVVEHAKPEG